MKNNKQYYTPSLAEFNDGFIFELNHNKAWVPCVFKLKEDLINFNIITKQGEVIDKPLELKDIRVKKLSLECLLNKGFTQKDDTLFIKMHPSLKMNKVVEVVLNNGKVNVSLQGLIRVVNHEVKNINELINLLKNLGLHE